MRIKYFPREEEKEGQGQECWILCSCTEDLSEQERTVALTAARGCQSWKCPALLRVVLTKSSTTPFSSSYRHAMTRLVATAQRYLLDVDREAKCPGKPTTLLPDCAPLASKAQSSAQHTKSEVSWECCAVKNVLCAPSEHNNAAPTALTAVVSALLSGHRLHRISIVGAPAAYSRVCASMQGVPG